MGVPGLADETFLAGVRRLPAVRLTDRIGPDSTFARKRFIAMTSDFYK
jgi:hypothetical protein